MGCSSSTGNISLFASLSERFVRDAGTDDSLIPLRSVDQSSKISLMGVVIKRTKKTSEKVIYRPYDFSLIDFLKNNKTPLTIEEKSTKVFTEYTPRRNSSLSGSAEIQAPRDLLNLKAEISKNETFSFTTGNVKMLQLNSGELVKALTSRVVDMANPVVRQIQNTNGTLCVVCKKIVVEENSKLSKNRSGGGSLILGAKPVANAGGEIKATYDSSANTSIGVSAGTTLAYSVWELQVDVKNGAIVPMVIGDTPGGFVGDDVTDNINENEMINRKDNFKAMLQVLEPFVHLDVDEHDVITKQLKTIMENPTDAKILDDIFDYAEEILEYPGNQHPKAPPNINLREKGVLNVSVCSSFLQTVGFKRTSSDANNKAAVLKKDSPVLYWPDSQTPLFQAFDYLFDIVDQLSETEIKALGHVTSLSGKVLLKICANHYGTDRTDAEQRLDIIEDQAAAILSLSMGLNYNQLTRILTFPDKESRSCAAIYTVLYAMYAEK